MIVKMFKPQFAALVEAGTKCQTVRPWPKRTPKVGDQISLRTWTGLSYRSKQRVLREATIEAVDLVAISETGVKIEGKPEAEDAFARADGFKDFAEMRDWFSAQHGLPFVGILIQWSN